MDENSALGEALTDSGIIIRGMPKKALAARRGMLGTCIFALIGVIGLGAALYFVTAGASAVPQNIEWPRYGHDLANTRFQDVDQINASNAADMRVSWVFHTGVLDPNAELEVSPIEVDGRLYVTDGHDDVFALDAATGKQKWAYKPTQIPGEMPPLDNVFACCGRNNHGVVFVPAGMRKDDDSNSEPAADDKSDREQASPAMVVFGRLDDVVVALNAKTGTVVWKTAVVDFHSRAAINMAPQFAHGLIIVGLSGGESRFADK